MKLLQKSLVVVILIQILVVVQLYFVKRDGCYAFFQNPFILVERQDSQKDNLLIDLLKKQIAKKRMVYHNLHYINENLALLERERVARVKKINKTIRNKIEQNAKKFLGYRYVWGATGPNKFDCSGFTQKVFKIVGINLPRVSREQAKVGKYVTFDALKKGDIVFFDTKRKKTGIVTHVGIYLEDGKFIHASSGGKRVMITSFKRRTFYKNRFLWGRRII